MGIYVYETLCGFMLWVSCQVEIEEEMKEGECNDLGYSKNIKLKCEAFNGGCRASDSTNLVLIWISNLNQLKGTD